MDFQSILYSDTAPYPPVEVDAPNPRYAPAILSNIGACNSEISAISLYFYNSLITRKNFQEIAECFHKISIVEMHHLDIFGELALKLGANPRLWSRQKERMHYWSPNCNRYLSGIIPLISNALASEQDTVYKYRAQSQWIKDSHICAILNRIIADEEIHIHIFKSLLSELTEQAPLPGLTPAPVSTDLQTQDLDTQDLDTQQLQEIPVQEQSVSIPQPEEKSETAQRPRPQNQSLLQMRGQNQFMKQSRP